MSHWHSADMKLALEREEDRLVHALSTIRTRINELAPISTLPIEILEEIFTFCICWLYIRYKPEHPLSWTQVCRSWRYISLNATRLWTCIDVNSSNFSQKCLERSGSSPIHIISSESLRPLKLCASDLQLHAKRVNSLDVYLYPKDLRSLFTLLGPDFPSLDSLSLSVPPVLVNFTLNVTFFSRLKRLDLRSVSIPWNTCLGLGELTHLSLHGLSTGFSPSMAELLTILKGSPQLERVQLLVISPDMSEYDTYHLPLISLPRLRELRITAKAPVILAILSNIDLPSKTRLEINCAQFDSLHDLFPSHLSTTYKATQFHSLTIEREFVHFFESPALPWSWTSSSSLICLGSVWPIARTSLPDIPHIFEISSITNLELGIAVLPELSPHLLKDLFIHMPNLEVLGLPPGDPIIELVSVLTERISPPISTFDLISHCRLLCPRLRQITFGQLTGHSCLVPERYSDWLEPGHYSKWLTPLLKLVRARHDAAVPLVKFEFKNVLEAYPELNKTFLELVAQINAWTNVDPSFTSQNTLAKFTR